MNKNDFKKMALLGMTAGLMLSASAEAADQFDNSVLLAGNGCAGKAGCHGDHPPAPNPNPNPQNPQQPATHIPQNPTAANESNSPYPNPSGSHYNSNPTNNNVNPNANQPNTYYQYNPTGTPNANPQNPSTVDQNRRGLAPRGGSCGGVLAACGCGSNKEQEV